MADETQIVSRKQTKLAQPVTDQDHAFGPASAVVTLVEYGDYQCEDSGRAYPIIKDLQRRSGSWLRFVFRNFPLDIHEHARLAAEAAEAAAAQDMFWEMHNYLFENQNKLDKDSLIVYAEFLGMDVDQFESDISEHKFAAKVDQYIDSGKQSGVTSTPALFINGLKYTGAIENDPLFKAIETAGDDISTEEPV